MVHATGVDIEEMRSRLLTLDDVRERLAETEPGNEVTFGPASASVRIDHGWADVPEETAPAGAWLRISGGDEIQLTKKAVLDLGAKCRLPRKLQADWPADLLQSVIVRVLADELTNAKTLKALTQENAGAVLATSVTSGTVIPFSNLALLDAAVSGITEFYGPGTEILADYKIVATPSRTDVRLIVPGHQRVIAGTRVADDTWSAGVAFTNSLTGTEPTDLHGYLFRHWCTNGCYDTLASVSALNRRQVSSADEAYEWARQSVDEVLGGLETSLASVQELTSIPVAGDVGSILNSLFSEFSVPAAQRRRIVSEMAELDGDLTMYDLMQATTVAANAEGVSPDAVDSLLALGGHLAHVDRCDESRPCRRPLPQGWAAE